LKLKEPLSSAIAAQTQSSPSRHLSALMNGLSIGANENANENPNATNPTKKKQIQGWEVQTKWGEDVPNSYGSPSYVLPRYALWSPKNR
jgi:hypothetical protein